MAELASNSLGAKLHAAAITSTKPSAGFYALLRRSESARAAWRHPTILANIHSAGQTVLGQKIITIQVTSNWVNTGLSIATAQHLWTDTRSDGKWTGNPRYFPYSDATGLGLAVYANCWKIDNSARVESLIGFIGSSPPNVPEGCHGGTTNPGFVKAGNTLLNLSPRTTGTIWLRTNDNTNHISNVGRQIVKVIVTT
jgi:hypothetical protein